MMAGTHDTVMLVPFKRIEILNSRDRNMKVFEEIVDNIRAIGLKKLIPSANDRAMLASRSTCWSAAKGGSTPSIS